MDCKGCGRPTVSESGYCARRGTECRKKGDAYRTRKASTKRLENRSRSIYVVGTEAYDYVKIGFTTRTPLSRVRNAQPFSPFEFNLLAAYPGDRKLERKLHTAFAESCVRGEWFDLGTHAEAIKRVEAVIQSGVI